jgi:hypothetical protein
MSNADTATDTRNDKRSALDDFASAPARDVVSAPSVQPMASPGDRVFGAQAVAVYRDEARILQKLAALGAAAGDDWFYRFPVKNKNGGKDFIEGASIKLANDVARIYGNCEVDTRVIDLGPSWLIYARFTDFESGYALTRPFQQNKNASKMGGDADRRLDISFQIGVSKAIRNVVVNALQTFSDFAFEAARNSLIDKIGKDVKKWQEKTLQGLAKHGVDAQRVEFVIGRASKDWTAPDLAKIIAMMKAIGDGMATIDETFPPKDKQVGEDIDRETGEVTEQSNSAASTETGETSTGAADAGSAAPNPTDPATDQTSSKQPTASAAATAASGQAAPATANPPKDAAKGAAKAPANEAEYVAQTEAWIAALTDAEAGEKRWLGDKAVRNKANVGGDAREELKAKLDAKCAEIRDADRS